MKWIGLAIMLASVWPILIYVRKSQKILILICFLFGFLPFSSVWLHLLVAPISWRWVGYTKGMEIFVLDILAIIMVIHLRKRLFYSPFIIPMALYLLATVIATFGAANPEAAAFYGWQVLRMIVLYLAVANIVAVESGAVAAILTGLAFGEILQCVMALYQRFGQHLLQAYGTLDSQNQLGMATHFVLFPFFALLLGGRRGWLPACVVVASLVTDVLTTSRATVGLGLLGIGLVTIISTLKKSSGRKIGIVLAGLAMLTILSPLAIASFSVRFAHSDLGLKEDEERLAFKRAAQMMWAEHPAGVGPNNFALVANIGGYYRRAGKGISMRGLSTNVHNAYLLALAEAGPLGLATFVLMLFAPIVVAFKYGVVRGGSAPDDPKRDLLIGIGVALLIVCIHSWEEWVIVVNITEYFLAVLFGVIAGLTAQERGATRHMAPASPRKAPVALSISAQKWSPRTA